jgi:hypothetical protein
VVTVLRLDDIITTRGRVLSPAQQRIFAAAAAGRLWRDELHPHRYSWTAGRRCTTTAAALHRLGLIQPGQRRWPDGDSTWQLTDGGLRLARAMGIEVPA